MAAPVLQAEGADSAATTGTLNPAIPTHQADDIIVVECIFWGPTPGTVPDDVPTPTNYTALGTQVGITDGTNVRGKYACFWRRVTGAGTTVTCTRGANWDTGADTNYTARTYVIRGCITSGNPYEDAQVAGPYRADTQNFAALTVSGSERLAIHFGGRTNAAGTPFGAAPSGWTAGTADSNTTGTDAAEQSYRKDNVSTNQAAAAPTVVWSGSGGYAYIGAVFVPPSVSVVNFAAAIAGVGSVAPAKLSETKPLALAVAGSGSVAPAKLTEERNLASAIAGVASVAPAKLTEERNLAAAIAATAALALNLSIQGQVFMQAAVAGLATITAALQEDKRLATLVAGGAQIAVGMKLTELLQAIVAGQAQILAAMTVTGGAAAAIVKDIDETVHIVMLAQ